MVSIGSMLKALLKYVDIESSCWLDDGWCWVKMSTGSVAGRLANPSGHGAFPRTLASDCLWWAACRRQPWAWDQGKTVTAGTAGAAWRRDHLPYMVILMVWSSTASRVKKHRHWQAKSCYAFWCTIMVMLRASEWAPTTWVWAKIQSIKEAFSEYTMEGKPKLLRKRQEICAWQIRAEMARWTDSDPHWCRGQDHAVLRWTWALRTFVYNTTRGAVVACGCARDQQRCSQLVYFICIRWKQMHSWIRKKCLGWEMKLPAWMKMVCALISGRCVPSCFSADDWSTRARRQQCGEASLEVKQRAVLYTHQRGAKALVGPHPPSEHSPQTAAGH